MNDRQDEQPELGDPRVPDSTPQQGLSADEVIAMLRERKSPFIPIDLWGSVDFPRGDAHADLHPRHLLGSLAGDMSWEFPPIKFFPETLRALEEFTEGAQKDVPPLDDAEFVAESPQKNALRVFAEGAVIGTVFVCVVEVLRRLRRRNS